MESNNQIQNQKYIKNILTVGSGSSGVLLNDNLEDLITFKHQNIKQQFEGNQVIEIDYDGMMGIALTKNNKVYRWGECDLQEGENKKRKIHIKPQILALNTKIQITNIACGWNHAVVYNQNLKNSHIFGFGSNTFGELGLGKMNKKFINEPIQINQDIPENNSQIDFIHCGFRQTYIKYNNTDFFVTGQNKKFELGIELETTKQTFDFIKNSNPEILNTIQNVQKNNFQTGQKFVCFKNENNELYGWGDNKFRQISDIDQEIITKIQKITDKKVQQFSLGWNHLLVLQQDNHLYMRGRNDMGQLSHGKEKKEMNQNEQEDNESNSIIKESEVKNFEHLLKLQLQNTEKIKQIACGSECNYFLTSEHRVFAWGWNEHGNLGDGTLENSYQVKEIQIDSSCKHEQIKAKGAICFLIERERE